LRRTFGLRTQNLICNTLRSYSQQAGGNFLLIELID